MGNTEVVEYEKEEALRDALIAIFHGNTQYYKSNAMINAKGKVTLTSLRLFAIGMKYSDVDPKTNCVTAVIPASQLRLLFNAKGNSLYRIVKKATYRSPKHTSLLDWKIIIKDGQKKQHFVALNVITKAEYEDGILTIRFNSDLTEQLLDLKKGNYTTLDLDNSLRLTTSYGFHLYEILKSQYDFLRAKNHINDDREIKWSINLTDLELRLGIIDASADEELINEIKSGNDNWSLIKELAEEKELIKYKRGFKDINDKILKPSIKDINEHTLLKVDYDTLKTGKSVTDIVFKIRNTTKKVTIEDAPKSKDVSEIANLLSSERLTTFDIENIADAADYNTDRVKKAYDCALAQDEISNLVGFMIKAIKDNYEPPIKKKKARAKKLDSFHNFEERTYDYGDLEKKLRKN